MNGNRVGLEKHLANGDVPAEGRATTPGSATTPDASRQRVTHPKCGKSWVQRGNRTGHCAKCHETFEGLTAFDAHQTLTEDGSVICAPPASVKVGGQSLRLVDGTWRGPGMPADVKAKYAAMRVES